MFIASVDFRMALSVTVINIIIIIIIIIIILELLKGVNILIVLNAVLSLKYPVTEKTTLYRLARLLKN